MVLRDCLQEWEMHCSGSELVPTKGFRHSVLQAPARCCYISVTSNKQFRLFFVIPEFLATDPEFPGSIPGATSLIRITGSGTGFTQPREDN
jgi:hypothetical protein